MADPAVRFVVSAVEPLRGMERAALDVVERLRADGLDVEVRVLDPGPPPRTRRQRARSLAASALPARAAVREPAGAVVLVGIWVGLRALPWVGGRVLRGTRDSGPGGRPPVLAWEHSYTRERAAASASFRLVAAVTLRLYARARAVVAVSPAVAQDLAATRPALASTTTVIPNPVAAEPTPPPSRTAAAAPGEPLLLLDLAAALPAAGLPTATLDVAGGGPLLGRLRSDVQRRGLGDRVTVHGHVPDVEPLLARADVLVHTSASETFGYALLEAAAAGVPVVAVENAQTRHLVPALVPGRTCAATGTALADAVRAVHADQEHGGGDDDRLAAWHARRAAFDPTRLVAAWREVLR